MKRLITLSLILSLSSTCGVALAEHHGMDMGSMDSSAKTVSVQNEAVGVVEQIDQAKGVVTITHEPVKSLGWPGMTMDFTVKDKALFSKLAPGAKIHFVFIKQMGKYVVTNLK